MRPGSDFNDNVYWDVNGRYLLIEKVRRPDNVQNLTAEL